MNKNKIMATLLAFVMMLSVFAPFEAFAASTGPIVTTGDLKGIVQKEKPSKTELIVHKLKATKYKIEKGIIHNGGKLTPEELNKLGEGVEEVDEVTFTYYKLKDAAQLDTFMKEPQNYSTKEQLKVEGVEEQGAVKTDGKDGGNVQLEDGYYWFIETEKPSTLTSVIAVPFGVSIPVTNSLKDGDIEANAGYLKTVHVYPKNVEEKPKTTKDNDKAKSIEYSEYLNEKHKAENRIGGQEKFTVKTYVPKDASYKSMNWTDTMTQGLTFDKGSLKIGFAKIGTDGKVENLENFSKDGNADYKIVEHNYGYEVELTEEGIKKVAEKAKQGGVDIALQYSATVNSAAVTDVPDKNYVTFNFDHKPNNGSDPLNPSKQEIKVIKEWAKGEAPVDVTVTYLLIDVKEDKVVQSWTKKTTQDDKDLSHTFKNLDSSRDYKVKEVVDGYTPEYKIESTDGTVTVTNTKSNNSITPTPPEVVTHEQKFVKTDGAGTRLAGAQFLVKDSTNKYLAVKTVEEKDEDQKAYEHAQAEYLKAIKAYNDSQEENKSNLLQTIKNNKETRDKAFSKAQMQYEFVDKQNNEARLVTVISNEDGQFVVKGLQKGVDYKLEETVAPKGFAKLSEDISFKVGEGSVKNINFTKEQDGIKDAQEVKNKKVTIPQTGGIGTIIFTVAGLAIMGGAFYAMKKRNEEQEEA